METFGVPPVFVLPPLRHALPTPVNVFTVDRGVVRNKNQPTKQKD